MAASPEDSPAPPAPDEHLASVGRAGLEEPDDLARDTPAALDAAVVQSLIQALPMPVVVMDADHNVVASNPAGEELLDDHDVDLGAAPPPNGRGPAGADRTAEHAAGDGGGSTGATWAVTPVTGDDGHLEAVVAVGGDGEPPNVLRQAIGMLDALLGTAPVGIAVFDTQGRFQRVNDVLAAMSGRDVDAHLGRTASEAMPDLDRNLDVLVSQVLTTGAPLRDVDLSVVNPDGSVLAWSASLFRLADADGATAGVGALVLDVSTQRQVEHERAVALSRLALTNRASELLSTSLDPTVVLSHLCDLLVPGLADHVYVDLREEGDRLRRVAIRHVEGVAVDDLLERPVGHLSSYRPEHPLRRAVEHGDSIIVDDLEGPGGVELPPGHDTDLVRSLKATSMMVMPMTVAGRRIGVVGILASVSGRHYDDTDRAMAYDVVTRAAVALSNALSYEQQRSAAVALQRSLLPGQLTSVEGLDVAWRYVPGSDDTMVGGDWVDVIELPGGRVGLTVGDVMGRGLRAAAVMGQLRTAVRTLASQDLQPAELLTRLDLIVEGLPSEQIVTCVYAIYDPGRGIITLSNAGHLPPVLLDGDQAVVMREAIAVPLGVGGVRFTEHEVAMPQGVVLALYTDGLVERNDADLDSTIGDLAATLGHGQGNLERRCSALLARSPALTGRGFDDDVALLLVRAMADPAESAVSHRFPPRPESVRQARRLLDQALTGWHLEGLDDLAMTAELLMSEVVTNAVRVSDEDLEVMVRRGEHAVWIEVADDDTRQPRMRQADADDEGGRGLAMVNTLASAWGTRPTPDGKTVWFRLDH